MLRNHPSTSNSATCLLVELRAQGMSRVPLSCSSAQFPGAGGGDRTAVWYCRVVFLSTFLMDPSLTGGGLCQMGTGVRTPSSHWLSTQAFIYFPVGLQKPPSFRQPRAGLPRPLALRSWSSFLHSEQKLPREPWSLSLHHGRNAKLEPPPVSKCQTHPHLFAECFFSMW